MSKKLSITLLCGTCGHQDFDFNEDKTWVQCTSCQREYHGGFDELKEQNQQRIDEGVKKVADETIEDMLSDFKRQFSGNTFIKFK